MLASKCLSASSLLSNYCRRVASRQRVVKILCQTSVLSTRPFSASVNNLIDAAPKINTPKLQKIVEDRFDKDDSFVVRLRGLPFTASSEEVVRFLSGETNPDIKIDPERCGIRNIHFTFSRDGRPSGEAFVEFMTDEDVKEAVKKNNDHMGQRYIEVFRSKRSDMDWMIKGAEHNQQVKEEAAVQLRGLPFGCSKEEIATFFTGLEIAPNGIILPVDRQGRSKGKAFVVFASKEIAEKALDKHKENIGQRYVEIFKSTMTDASQARQRIQRGTNPGSHYVSATGHGVHMRGMPFQASEQDVYDFFNPVRPVKVEFEYAPNGRPTGEANVDFGSHQEAVEAMKKHKSNMQHRYIELFLHSAPGEHSRQERGVMEG